MPHREARDGHSLFLDSNVILTSSDVCMPNREARNGPYNLFIDAANVAFYGQNFEGGGFNWGQVMRMVKKVDKEHPDRKLLVVSKLLMNVQRHVSTPSPGGRLHTHQGHAHGEEGRQGAPLTASCLW